MGISEIGNSSTTERYLEAIYRLEGRTDCPRTGEIARRLKVAPGTVTGYINYLKDRDLVLHRPYRGVNLTDKGRRIALDAIRKHRLSERLMTDMLGMDWSKAHTEACLFQQGLSSDLLRPLEEVLGYPKTCPHGNPIPTRCSGVVEEESEPLINLDLNQAGTVVKIIDEYFELLQYLATLGIKPNAHVTVQDKTPRNKLITLRVDGESRTVNETVASVVWVKVDDIS